MTFNRRISINLDDSVTDEEAIWAVANVIAGGRISGYPTEDTYCYHTSFTNDIQVSASRTQSGNDTFHVYRSERRD